MTPDLKIDPRSLSAISQTLIVKSLIFNYATRYHATHPTIASATAFSMSDEDYNEFIQYLSDKDYDYETETESLLKELKKTAEEEFYFEQAKEEYELLKGKMVADKKDDLTKFKSEIKELLEYEIVSRYHYNRGRIEASLDKDPVVHKALKVLSNKEDYQSILKGTYKRTETN